MTMLDWRDFGEAYAGEMILMANALATKLEALGVPVFSGTAGFTNPHHLQWLHRHLAAVRQHQKKCARLVCWHVELDCRYPKCKAT